MAEATPATAVSDANPLGGKHKVLGSNSHPEGIVQRWQTRLPALLAERMHVNVPRWQQ